MKVKIPHRLKSNKTTSLPSQFIFFDTETKPVKGKDGSITHRLKLGWACYWLRRSNLLDDTIIWQEFTTEKQFWDFVCSHVRSKTRLILLAHNIVFDFTVAGGWYELVNRGWKLSRLYEKNHIFIAKYKKKDMTILLLDNMNFFACRLEQLGQEIGFEKLKINFSKCTNEQLSIYCRRDTEILLKTWQKYMSWHKQNDLGTFGVTISAQAFNTFRHRFMKHDIYIHNRRYVSNLERESYFGGRTECFRLGSYSNDKFYNLDVNSMYPSVMATCDFPTKFVNYDLSCGIGKLSIYLQKYCCVARVKINTKKPMLPVRGKIIKKPKRYDRSLFEDNQFTDLKSWIIQKGGIKPEYYKVNGKLKLRDEYMQIPKYYRRRNGRAADELADELSSEKPELYNSFNMGSENSYPSYRLLEVMGNTSYINSDVEYLAKNDDDEDFYCEVVKGNSKGSFKVIFPVGNFEAVLTTGELKLALAENAIGEVFSVALYEKDRIFSDFIKFFYDQRLQAKAEGNSSYSQFYKIIMNSLYGKFGQLMGEWETCGKCDPKEVKYWRESRSGDLKIYHYRKINGLVQKYEKKREAFNSFCAVASHVTGYARVKMWQLMEKAGRSNVYYCDTDSLFVNSLGYKNLKSELSASEIGKLKIENEATKLDLLGCKQYVFGSKKKHKGRKNDAVKLSDNVYKQTQWSTLKTLIQNEDLKNYKVTEVIKHFTGKYDKGYLQPNGTVTPLVL